MKLDELAAMSSSDATTGGASRAQVNALTSDALSKGQSLLDAAGWESPRTEVSIIVRHAMHWTRCS